MQLVNENVMPYCKKRAGNYTNIMLAMENAKQQVRLF